MFPLLETVRFENGVFANVDYHIYRMIRSAKNCLKSGLKFDPFEIFQIAGNEPGEGLFKFRVLYNGDTFKTGFVKYSLPNIKTLKPVEAGNIDYHCKFSDRTALTRLASEKGDADDVLILKNGVVTDTSFANIIFFDGKNWLTPKTPLLKGTQRAYLLDKGVINTALIKSDDLKSFEKGRIINAMIRFEDEINVKII